MEREKSDSTEKLQKIEGKGNREREKFDKEKAGVGIKGWVYEGAGAIEANEKGEFVKE